ncbi:MAG: response regulator [Gemmataceae bacterium]
MLWLLVDDDPQMAVIVRVLLRRAGHQLTVAADGAAASRAVAEARPDLILLDVNLPGESGLDWLRRQADRPPVALFIQSGLAADVAAGWDAGAEYVLAKELVSDPSGWRRRVDEIITHRDGRGEYGSLASAPSGDLSGWWNPALDRALGSVPVPQLVALLRRSLRTGLGGSDEGWVDAERGRLLPREAGAALARRCGDVLIDQTGCMLGGAASRALMVALERR